MYDISIKIKNYKCFVEESGFDTIKRVNIVIGRNNVGKSALLDVIEHIAAKNYEFDRNDWRNSQLPQIIFSKKIEELEIKRTFYANDRHEKFESLNAFEYGRKLINRKITWTKKADNHFELLSCEDKGISPTLVEIHYDNQLLINTEIPIEEKVFKRMLAERNVVPEIFSDTISINSNGNGVTNAVVSFLSRIELKREIIEIKFMEAINEIYADDAEFLRITHQFSLNRWEIYFEEKSKGRISLSKSGSGLKTVITVLSFLLLIPIIERKSLNNYIFAFEELENNMHPALLRRLNTYIYKTAIEKNFIYFLTTHSNVLIDQFSKQNDAQIIHITQNDGWSKTVTVQTYLEKNGILDDLDIRASDLLQSNGVIWVEGPSDRIYLNRWIDLWSNGQLKEGTHYQIVFYGGRILSHFSADEENFKNEKVSIFNINRNAIILIDSDKNDKNSTLNLTKERIINEFKKTNKLSWVTKGKEIENYIPVQVAQDFFKLNMTIINNEYESFFVYLDKIENNLGTKYSSQKPLLAEKLIPFMTKENMHLVLDIDDRMNELCERIKYWNKINEIGADIKT